MTQSSGTPAPSSNLVGSTPGVVSAPRAERRSEPAVQETLVDLWEKLAKLMQQELALAKAELSEKVQHLKLELLGSIAGAALLLAGLLALVAAVILLLALAMPSWLAALLTGAVTAGAGYLLVSQRRNWGAEIKPERTLENLKKDIQTFTEAGR